jgi:hypothetical protein
MSRRTLLVALIFSPLFFVVGCSRGNYGGANAKASCPYSKCTSCPGCQAGKCGSAECTCTAEKCGCKGDKSGKTCGCSSATCGKEVKAQSQGSCPVTGKSCGSAECGTPGGCGCGNAK